MKKVWLYVGGIVVVFAVACLVLFNFTKKDNDSNLKKVRLAEVAHTIFYAPQYVAIEKGYFKDLGIDLDLHKLLKKMEHFLYLEKNIKTLNLKI